MRSAPEKSSRLKTALIICAMVVAFVVPPAVGFVGCQSIESGAKETFSHENTCPPERVETRERPELRPASFSDGVRAPVAPPSDIAADPERLKMWRAEQAKAAHGDDNHHIIEARGCGKHLFYDCRHSLSTDRVGGASWVCSAETHVPAAITGW